MSNSFNRKDNKMVNELNKYDTVIVISKSNDSNFYDILFKGIIIRWYINERNLNYPYSSVTIIFNTNSRFGGKKISHKAMQRNSIQNLCKILPARIVLTEKKIDWEWKNS